MEVVAEAGHGPEALRQCQRVHPDVALVDVSMPVWDGVKTTEMLRSACPQVRIVSVSRHNDESFVRWMFEAGAVGYVLTQTLMAQADRSSPRNSIVVLTSSLWNSGQQPSNTSGCPRRFATS